MDLLWFIDTNDIVFYSQVLRHVNLIFFDKKNISCCIMMHHVYDASCVFYSCCLLEMFDIFICCWKNTQQFHACWPRRELPGEMRMQMVTVVGVTQRWSPTTLIYSQHQPVEHVPLLITSPFTQWKKRCLVEEMLLICSGNFTRNSTQIVSYTHTHTKF